MFCLGPIKGWQSMENISPICFPLLIGQMSLCPEARLDIWVPGTGSVLSNALPQPGLTCWVSTCPCNWVGIGGCGGCQWELMWQGRESESLLFLHFWFVLTPRTWWRVKGSRGVVIHRLERLEFTWGCSCTLGGTKGRLDWGQWRITLSSSVDMVDVKGFFALGGTWGKLDWGCWSVDVKGFFTLRGT